MRNLGKLTGIVVALSLLMALGFFLKTQVGHRVRTAVTSRALPFGRATANKESANARKVYPFSVVPGGVYSAEELARSRRLDPVVAKHYAGFGDKVLVQKTVREISMYVSYRKADRVYWTRRKHRISSGEYVMTDGTSFARARCGNRLSATPQEPVMEAGEPDESGLGKPEPPENTSFADVLPEDAEKSASLPVDFAERSVLDPLSNAAKQAVSDIGGAPMVSGANWPGIAAFLPATKPSPANSRTGEATNPGFAIPLIAELVPEPSCFALVLCAVAFVSACAAHGREVKPGSLPS